MFYVSMFLCTRNVWYSLQLQLEENDRIHTKPSIGLSKVIRQYVNVVHT